MSFLKFDEHNKVVIVVSEAEDFEVIKFLREKDNTPTKKFYNNVLQYVYHVYKKEHIFSNLSIKERKTKACELYMQSRDYKQYEENSNVQKLIKLYISLEYSQNEWVYQGIKNDIHEIKDSISNIPLTKKIMFEQSVDVEVPCGAKGKTVVRTVKVKQEVPIDNTTERMKALDRLLDLQLKEEKFREIIARDNKIKEHNNEMSLLESNYFNEK